MGGIGNFGGLAAARLIICAIRVIANLNGRFSMIGIFLIAHAPLASALRDCAKHVYSCDADAYERLRVLDVLPDADSAVTLDQARALVAEAAGDGGTLVFTDVFGATPGNVAQQLADNGQTAVVAGVNLPMLLRALCYRGGKLAEVEAKAVAGGHQGIVQVLATPVQHQGLPTSRP